MRCESKPHTIPQHTEKIYNVAIFLGAFLLFQVQPISGKYLLPWFGGSSDVWLTCVLFFQILLLAGYLYSHVLTKLSLNWQGYIHVILIIAGIVYLLIFSVKHAVPVPRFELNPELHIIPAIQILSALWITIGIPYFLLSTTTPLLQYWYSHAHQSATPYHFYALSNSGSLLALLTYPFIFEWLLPLSWQADIWSGLFILFGVTMLWMTGTIVYGRTDISCITPENKNTDRLHSKNYLFWIGFPMVGSLFFLSTTSQIIHNIYNLPFFWILPLAVYLLTFILCFSSRRFYNRNLYSVLFLVSTGCLVITYLFNLTIQILMVKLLLYVFSLFTGCMLCHGEVYRRKPAVSYLTIFYFCLAFGGVLGSMFVCFLAPAIFDQYQEFFLSFICVILIALYVFSDEQWGNSNGMWRKFGCLYFMELTVAIVILVSVHSLIKIQDAQTVDISRSYYGVVKVNKGKSKMGISVYKMVHGLFIHGIQYSDPDLPVIPTTYFTENSGVSLALNHHPNRKSDEPLRITAIGLGAGTIAYYGMPGDHLTFFEINSDVIRFANKWFTFLKKSLADITILQGDGRQLMDREQRNLKFRRNDIVVIDAFGGDTIPAHLLTIEAFELYSNHIDRNEGIITVHVTNKYFDFIPMLQSIAHQLNFESIVIKSKNSGDLDLPSLWILMTNNQEFLQNPHIQNSADKSQITRSMGPVWTDNHNSLFRL